MVSRRHEWRGECGGKTISRDRIENVRRRMDELRKKNDFLFYFSNYWDVSG